MEAVLRIPVQFVERFHVLFHRFLDGVVHLGGQDLILAVVLGQGLIDLVILGLIGFRGRIHRIQALAVPGQDAQGQLPAEFLAHGGVHRFDGIFLIHLGLGVQDFAVLGIHPDVPHPAGGRQRDAGGIVDLAADGFDGGILQLLLRGKLPVFVPVPDLDVVQAEDDVACDQQQDPYRQCLADHAHLPAQAPLPGSTRRTPPGRSSGILGRFLHGILLQVRPDPAARPAVYGFG